MRISPTYAKLSEYATYYGYPRTAPLPKKERPVISVRKEKSGDLRGRYIDINI